MASTTLALPIAFSQFFLVVIINTLLSFFLISGLIAWWQEFVFFRDKERRDCGVLTIQHTAISFRNIAEGVVWDLIIQGEDSARVLSERIAVLNSGAEHKRFCFRPNTINYFPLETFTNKMRIKGLSRDARTTVSIRP